jgi:hypothetical protein
MTVPEIDVVGSSVPADYQIRIKDCSSIGEEAEASKS